MSFIPSGCPPAAERGRVAVRKVNAAAPSRLRATRGPQCRYREGQKMEATMRSILLWLIGIPIPVIILLYLFGVF
jgi:hypothetical protein